MKLDFNTYERKFLIGLLTVFITLQILCCCGLAYCIHLIKKRTEQTTEKPNIETNFAKQPGKPYGK